MFLRRWGAAGLPASPPAHLPVERAEAATGQTLRPAEATPAIQAQHGRSGQTDMHTWLHSLEKGQLNLIVLITQTLDILK